MQLAIDAAARADETLRAKEEEREQRGQEEERRRQEVALAVSVGCVEQRAARALAIAAIEADHFQPGAFLSSRSTHVPAPSSVSQETRGGGQAGAGGAPLPPQGPGEAAAAAAATATAAAAAAAATVTAAAAAATAAAAAAAAAAAVTVPKRIQYRDPDSLADASLFVDKEEAEQRWLRKLLEFRQERLMGNPVG
ncbi:unnamed protein product [Lampetra fluviatilis]